MREPMSLFALNMGETAFTAIDRICREAGVLPVSDGLGGPGPDPRGAGQRSDSPLVQGQNILAAKGHYSWRERASPTITYSPTRPGSTSRQRLDAHMGHAGRCRRHAVAPEIHRRLIFAMSPSPTFRNMPSGCRPCRPPSLTVRRSSCRRAGKTIPDCSGHRMVAVKTTSGKLGIDGDMLVVSTRHIEDDQGSRTELGLGAPDAYKLIALNSGNDLINPGAGSSDICGIRSAVSSPRQRRPAADDADGQYLRHGACRHDRR